MGYWCRQKTTGIKGSLWNFSQIFRIDMCSFFHWLMHNPSLSLLSSSGWSYGWITLLSSISQLQLQKFTRKCRPLGEWNYLVGRWKPSKRSFISSDIIFCSIWIAVYTRRIDMVKTGKIHWMAYVKHTSDLDS